MTVFRRFNPVRRLALALRARQDRQFDDLAGTETRSSVPVHDMNLSPIISIDACDYGPTSVADFRRLIRKSGVRPATTHFTDLGCSKGPALLLAAEAGFAEVIGVEVDRSLCEAARRNAALWSAHRPMSPPIQIIETEARDYAFPAGDLFVYLFNPFDGAVFDAVAARLSLMARDPSRIIMIGYNNHRLGDRIDETGAFVRQNIIPILPWRRPAISFYRSKRELANQAHPSSGN